MNNLDKIMKELDETQESGKDFFKFPTGTTKIRILTDFTNTYSLFEGEYPNGKFVKKLEHYQKPDEGFTVKTQSNAWAIVRGKPDQLKIISFSYSLMKALSALTADPEWEFEGFPMKHDLTIGNTGEGGARYSLIGSPNKSEVPTEIMAELSRKLGKKGMGQAAFTGKDYPVNENDPDGEGIDL